MSRRTSGFPAREQDHRGLLDRVRRFVSWHRRWVAAALAGLAVIVGLAAAQPPPAPTVEVLVAGRNLPPGHRLEPDDLRTTRLPPDAVPAGIVRGRDGPIGRTLAGPMRSGEPLTDVRLTGPSLLRAYGSGVVAASVPVADAGLFGALHAGDRVDVLAAEVGPDGQSAGPARRVVRAVPVLATREPGGSASGDSSGPAGPIGIDLADGGAGSGDGSGLLLAVSPDDAARLAGAALTARLSVVLRGS